MRSSQASRNLLHVFSTFAAAGPQVRTARLIAALGPSWRHSILAMDGCTDARSLLPAEVEILEPLPRAGTLGTVRALRRLMRGLRPDLLLTYNWGAIEAVLAEGVRAVFAADIGLAATGILSRDHPSGEPAGTVFIGLARDSGTETRRVRLPGDRNRIRQYAVISMFDFLRHQL